MAALAAGFRLRITSGRGTGKEFVFAQPSVRIGRLPENDLVLYDVGVSRRHCEIFADGEVFTLRDIGSANGTLLNDTITTEARLKSGDRIQVGPVAFVFQQDQTARERSGQSFVFRPENTKQQRVIEEQKTMAVISFTPPGSRPSPARVLTNRFRAYGNRWRRMPRSTKLALVASTGVLLFAVLLSSYMLTHRPRPDRSAEIFAADRSNAALSFGSGKVDVFTPDRVNFQFDYQGGRVTLTYAVGGVESANELAILLNGEHVADVKPSPGRWTTGLTTVLPRGALRPGTNIFTFDNTLTPTQPERWGVAQVQVEQLPLPPVDVKRADELYQLGQTSFDTRSVSPPNLYRALEYYEQARTYVEAADTPPPLAATIDRAAKIAAAELQNVYDSYMFTAEKSLRFGDRNAALEALNELLLYLPNPEDPRAKQAKQRQSDIAVQGAP